MAQQTEECVARHYARGATWSRVILGALAASARISNGSAPSDLSPVDEFHTGGRQAPSSSPRRSTSRPACTSWTSAAASAARRAFSPPSAAAASPAST